MSFQPGTEKVSPTFKANRLSLFYFAIFKNSREMETFIMTRKLLTVVPLTCSPIGVEHLGR